MTAPATPRLLDADTTAAVILGASDWTKAGLGQAPSFRRSAKGIQRYLFDNNGLCLDPELVLDLFNDPASAGEQLPRLRDTLDELLRERREAGRPVTDLLIYYIGHGSTDDQGRLTLLVRASEKGLETETGIKAADLARVLKVSAPQQRRLVVLDCCFSEAAARDFVGQGGLDQAVAATAVKDIAEALPSRGGVLLCSSPVGEIGIGKPDAAHTLFTGAVIEVLRSGVAWRDSLLSFADLRDEAYDVMLQSFGARAPRPALHAFNQTSGDLSRFPAFPNSAFAAESQARRREPEVNQSGTKEAPRQTKVEADRGTRGKSSPEREFGMALDEAAARKEQTRTVENSEASLLDDTVRAEKQAKREMGVPTGEFTIPRRAGTFYWLAGHVLLSVIVPFFKAIRPSPTITAIFIGIAVLVIYLLVSRPS